MSDAIECPECGDTFDGKKGLAQHYGHVHPDAERPAILQPTSIRVSQSTHDALAGHKREGESWDDLLARAAGTLDALAADGGQDECPECGGEVVYKAGSDQGYCLGCEWSGSGEDGTPSMFGQLQGTAPATPDRVREALAAGEAPDCPECGATARVSMGGDVECPDCEWSREVGGGE